MEKNNRIQTRGVTLTQEEIEDLELENELRELLLNEEIDPDSIEEEQEEDLGDDF